MKSTRHIKYIAATALVFAMTIVFAFSATAGVATLKLVNLGDKVAVKMKNDVPVLGVEFILKDMPDIATAQRLMTTVRSKGFLAQFNDLGDKGVKVILVSLDGKAISPGIGPILKIAYKTAPGVRAKKADLTLTDVNVADINNKPVNVTVKGTSL